MLEIVVLMIGDGNDGGVMCCACWWKCSVAIAVIVVVCSGVL